MKKKIVTICLVIALLAVTIAGASLAYFTDTQEKDNVFTLGKVDIELDEPEWNPDPEGGFKPGIAYDKDPYIKNVGDTEVWVRMRVTFSDYTALKTAADKYNVTLISMFGELNTTDWTLDTAEPVVDATADTITYTYYYNTKLAAGSETPRLFTTVTIPAQFTQEDMANLGTNADGNNVFTITVAADAIQDADAFTNYTDAFAAFDSAA